MKEQTDAGEGARQWIGETAVGGGSRTGLSAQHCSARGQLRNPLGGGDTPSPENSE